MRGFAAGRVSDGTRTRDRLDHNQELYRLSYAHRGVPAGQGPGDARNLAAASRPEGSVRGAEQGAGSRAPPGPWRPLWPLEGWA
jgi:hypothetical protein